jgi:hypothetical protein
METIIAILLSIDYALIIGIISGHYLLTYPTIFQILDDTSAIRFQRKILTRFFFVLLLFSLLAVLITRSFIIMAGVNSSFALVGWLSVPIMNLARDRNWIKTGSFFEKLTIYLTLSIFIFALTEIIRISLSN